MSYLTVVPQSYWSLLSCGKYGGGPIARSDRRPWYIGLSMISLMIHENAANSCSARLKNELNTPGQFVGIV